MKFRKGDKVSIIGTVKHDCDDDDNSVAVDLKGHYQTLWAEVAIVDLIEPKFIVGDRVSMDGIRSATVRAISLDGFLWVQDRNGSLFTWSADGVSREEPEQVDEPAEPEAA
jgi:hypothetical protein